MQDTVVLDGNCAIVLPLSGEMSLTNVIDGESGIITKVKEGDYYTGPTEVTPSAEEQRLVTTGFIMPEDIVINPIPDNYGLIGWNGSVLTVS